LVGAVGIGTSRLAENTQLVEKYQPLEKLKTLNWAKSGTRLTRGIPPFFLD
jgi:hypothetical protein